MSQFFVKIDGFKGPGTGVHAGWLIADSLNFGPPREKTIVISRASDTLSHQLWLAQARGTALGTVLIDGVKNGQRYIRLELADVYISSMSYGGAEPVEVIAFTYIAARITFQADTAKSTGAPLTLGPTGQIYGIMTP